MKHLFRQDLQDYQDLFTYFFNFIDDFVCEFYVSSIRV
jgi:hypothetical protein